MSGGFCPHDFHGTTEADLQQMSWGEDYDFWSDANAPLVRSQRGPAALVRSAQAQLLNALENIINAERGSFAEAVAINTAEALVAAQRAEADK